MPVIEQKPARVSHIKKNYDDRIYAMTIGSNIFHRRKYRGLTQQELSKKTGLTQASISDIENGDGNPTIDSIAKTAAALQVSIDMITKNRIMRHMIEAIDYMAQKIPNIDILKAMKLLYFTDLESKKVSGNKITGLQYIRRNRGPFCPDVYQLDAVFSKKKNIYQPEKFCTYVSLTAADRNFLNYIIEKYGASKATQLMELSYKTSPMHGYKKGDTKGMGTVVL